MRLPKVKLEDESKKGIGRISSTSSVIGNNVTSKKMLAFVKKNFWEKTKKNFSILFQYKVKKISRKDRNNFYRFVFIFSLENP